jgi:hypothetical protein
MNTLRPDVRLGRGVFQRVSDKLSSGRTLFLRAYVEEVLHLIELARHLRGRFLGLVGIFVYGVKLPMIADKHISMTSRILAESSPDAVSLS